MKREAEFRNSRCSLFDVFVWFEKVNVGFG